MYLRFTGRWARPWFERHGKKLTDLYSFRTTLTRVELEIDDNRRLLKDIEEGYCPKELEKLRKEIEEAEKLAAEIRERIAELETATLRPRGDAGEQDGWR